jgi:hypothetical protein
MFSVSSAPDSGNQGLMEALCEVTNSFSVISSGIWGRKGSEKWGAETYPMVITRSNAIAPPFGNSRIEPLNLSRHRTDTRAAFSRPSLFHKLSIVNVTSQPSHRSIHVCSKYRSELHKTLLSQNLTDGYLPC